jgi:hypothetical protein
MVDMVPHVLVGRHFQSVRKICDMTSNRRANLLFAFGFAGLVALAGCEKGPDKAQTAAELKSGVEEQLKKLEGSSAQKVLSHSAVNVTPQDDDTYLVSIEGLKIQPAPDGYLEIGTVSYLAKPKDEKSYEVSDLKAPQTMPFKGPDGKERGKLTITTKSFSGLYSKELGAFQKLDGEFADIAATDDTGGDVRVANAKFTGGLTDKGGGVVDSVGNLVLSGFTAKDTGDGTFSIAEARIDGKYDSMKVADYQAAMVKYQELIMKQAALVEQGASPPASLSPEDQKAMTEAITAMAASIKGGDFKIALNGLKYSEAGAEPFSMGGLTVGTVIDGINQEKASFNLDIAHQDLAVKNEEMTSPVTQASLPKSGNLSLKITDIPSQDIVKVLADNLPGVASADSAMAEANAMAMLVALQAVLQASGAKIEVAPSQLASELVEMKADGLFNVVQQSMFGVVGALNVAIRGMDELVALAQKTPEDMEAQQVMGTAGMLQQYSAREQGADGKPVDKFKIEINEAGQILVNGKPLM